MNFPQEVLSVIFQSPDTDDGRVLSAQDMFQCQLVCKSWGPVAQRTNYASLTVQGHHDLSKLMRTFHQSTTLFPAKFVRELFINDVNYQRYLIPLLDLLPCIVAIKVAEPDIEFYSNLITIRERNSCRYLKNIQVPLREKTGELIQVYTTCVGKYNNLLQNLLLYNNSTLMSRLHQFPRLQHLIVKKHKDIESMECVLDPLPSLNKLTIDMYETIPFSTNDAILPCMHLKTLDCLFIAQDSTLLYIMRKFPRLNMLLINIIREEDDDEEDISMLYSSISVTASVISQFMVYILSIPIGGVTIFLETPLIIQALNTYTKHMPTERLDVLSIIYSRGHKKHTTQWTIERVTNLKESHQFFIDYRSLTNELFHLKLIEAVGDYLSEITYRTEIDCLNNVHGYVFDHFLHYCPNLTKLRLSSTKVIRCPSISLLSSPHSSLTHLVLLNCYLGKDVFKGFSERLKKLKKLVVIRCKLGSSGLNPRYYHIDMVDTDIDTVRLKSEYNVTFITVRITQTSVEEEERNKYYRLCFDASTRNHRTEPSIPIEYELMFPEDQNLQVWIQCKRVRSVQLFTNSKGGQAVFGEIIV